MKGQNQSTTTISVIVPAFGPGEALGNCLAALLSGTRVPDQILVVDDGSPDPVTVCPADPLVSILRIEDGPSGPALARNLGCRKASGDVLVFVDSDVAVHPDALRAIEAHFRQERDLAAVFGSYDGDPPARDPVSLYRNLLHHDTHARGRKEASTFWSGLGAIRRDAFWAVGGFNEKRTRPCGEDIELGIRLKSHGFRICLDPAIQGKHLKKWSFARFVLTDARDRAWPWAHMVMASRHIPNDLNLDGRNRLGVIGVWTALAGFFGSIFDRNFLYFALAGIVLFAGVNAGLWRHFRRHGGSGFVLAAVFLHFVHLVVGSLSFGAGMVDFGLRRMAGFFSNRKKKQRLKR